MINSLSNLLTRFSSIVKWACRPIHSSLKEYSLIARIWKGEYPENTQQIPLSPLERTVMTVLVAIRSLSLTHLCRLATQYRHTSFLSESYVLLRFTVLCVMLIQHSSLPRLLIFVIVIYCIVDGFNYRLCIIFVDRYARQWGLRSLNRSLILLLVNYLEIVVGFATLYLLTQSVGFSEKQIVTCSLDALYFSMITITTVGYGDIRPICSIGRWLSIAETLMGIILIVIVIGTFLTGVANIRNLQRKEERDLNHRFDV